MQKAPNQRGDEGDVRAVYSDIHVLLRAGLLDRASDGRVEFACDAIHVDFVLHAAA